MGRGRGRPDPAMLIRRLLPRRTDGDTRCERLEGTRQQRFKSVVTPWCPLPRGRRSCHRKTPLFRLYSILLYHTHGIPASAPLILLLLRRPRRQLSRCGGAGTSVIFKWRGKPVFIKRRDDAMIEREVSELATAVGRTDGCCGAFSRCCCFLPRIDRGGLRAVAQWCHR